MVFIRILRFNALASVKLRKLYSTALAGTLAALKRASALRAQTADPPMTSFMTSDPSNLLLRNSYSLMNPWMSSVAVTTVMIRSITISVTDGAILINAFERASVGSAHGAEDDDDTDGDAMGDSVHPTLVNNSSLWKLGLLPRLPFSLSLTHRSSGMVHTCPHVGASVGASVAEAVGSAVVGDVVGDIVGSELGGEPVGEPVSDTVGSGVVSASVGCVVGIPAFGDTECIVVGAGDDCDTDCDIASNSMHPMQVKDHSLWKLGLLLQLPVAMSLTQ